MGSMGSSHIGDPDQLAHNIIIVNYGLRIQRGAEVSSKFQQFIRDRLA